DVHRLQLDSVPPRRSSDLFEDAWKSGPEDERELWRGLAQIAVGLTHSARGNTEGGARLLRRGAGALAPFAASGPHGIAVAGLGRSEEHTSELQSRENIVCR